MSDAMTKAICGLYDAVLEEGLWERALASISDATGSAGFNIFLLDRRTGDVPLALSYGIPDQVLGEYNAHYVKCDPGIQFFLKFPRLPFYYNYLHTAELDIDRSEYYSWLQASGGSRYYLAQTLDIDARLSMIATAQRPASIGHAQREDMEVLARLGPHIQRAMRLRLLVTDLNVRLGAAYDALDQVPQGVCLLSGTSCILYANRVARQLTLAEDSIRIGKNRLELANSSAQSRLNAAISAASGPAGSAAASGLRIDREGRRPIAIHVLSIGSKMRERLVGAPNILLLFYDPDRQLALRSQDLAALFGLTSSEAEIALALAYGRTPAEVCRMRGIANNTLKTHRRRIFDKIGVSSQAELARVLSGY